MTFLMGNFSSRYSVLSSSAGLLSTVEGITVSTCHLWTCCSIMCFKNTAHYHVNKRHLQLVFGSISWKTPTTTFRWRTTFVILFTIVQYMWYFIWGMQFSAMLSPWRLCKWYSTKVKLASNLFEGNRTSTRCMQMYLTWNIFLEEWNCWMLYLSMASITYSKKSIIRMENSTWILMSMKKYIRFEKLLIWTIKVTTSTQLYKNTWFSAFVSHL